MKEEREFQEDSQLRSKIYSPSKKGANAESSTNAPQQERGSCHQPISHALTI